MSIFDLFKPKTKVQPQLTDAELRWNHIWDLWTEGKAASPYAELMTYESEVNNGGHSQFFCNVSNTDDLQKVMNQLRSVLSEELKQNLEDAYRAALCLEENEKDEEAERTIDACDSLFFERESEIERVLEQYASTMDFKYFITEQKRNGTCYHEFYKGKWDKKTFWKEDSLLLHDDILQRSGLVKIFVKVICNYNCCGPTEIDQKQWNEIRKSACTIGGAVEQVISEIEPWVEENFKEHAVFTVLGI